MKLNMRCRKCHKNGQIAMMKSRVIRGHTHMLIKCGACGHIREQVE